MRPIERSTLSQQVATSIRNYIAEQQLKPGDKLPPERELSEHFRVSRIVVREALRLLHAEGAVSVQQGKGTYVQEFDGRVVGQHLTLGLPSERALFVQLLELREIIECGGFDLVAARATDEDWARLRGILAEMRREVERGGNHVAHDLAFHRALLDVTKNAPLSRLGNIIDEFFRVRSKVFPPPQYSNVFIPPRDVVREHEAILDALQRGDTNEAKQIYLETGSVDRTPPVELDTVELALRKTS